MDANMYAVTELAGNNGNTQLHTLFAKVKRLGKPDNFMFQRYPLFTYLTIS